jgi:hypothetical protein
MKSARTRLKKQAVEAVKDERLVATKKKDRGRALPRPANLSVRRRSYLSLADSKPRCIILLSHGYAQTRLAIRHPCTFINPEDNVLRGVIHEVVFRASIVLGHK